MDSPPAVQPPDPSGAQRRRALLLPGVGIVLVAINLRPAAACLGPVLTRIEHSVGLTSSTAGLLSTLPVLCFGLLAPFAPWLARRLGLRRSLAASLWVLLAGSLLRLIPGVGFLFAGTAVAGAAIAVGNVLLPVFVRRDVPERTGAAMALYSTSLIASASLAAGATVPIADALGGGWRRGLAAWAVPALLGALAWSVALWRHDPAGGGAGTGTGARTGTGTRTGRAEGLATWTEGTPHVPVHALLRSPLAWQVTLFFACQSSLFYATLAWLPSIFQSHGMSASRAGILLAVSMAVGVLAAPTIPHLAGRPGAPWRLAVACCGLTAAGLAGILLAPMSAPYMWVVLLGLGQNAMFPLALMLIVGRGGDVAHTQALSTLAQSVGYGLAALGPLLVGALHGLTGSWTAAIGMLLALVVPELVLGLLAARPRTLGGPNALSGPDVSKPSPVKQERSASVHTG